MKAFESIVEDAVNVGRVTHDENLNFHFNDRTVKLNRPEIEKEWRGALSCLMTAEN
jgi:phosphoribosylformylglycinamidine synthase